MGAAPETSSQPQAPQAQLPISAEIATMVQHAPSSAEPSANAAGLPKLMMYKNQLQEFAQKSNIALPMYQIVNEGTSHAPRFRSTVWVNEKSYTTQITFSDRKVAEQDAARLALESLPKIIKDEASPLVWENTLSAKSILKEYATKLNVNRPTYKTVQITGVLPVFVSTLVFNGKKYTGDVSRKIKEARQLAARRAILSILDEPNSGTLFEIIKPKSRIFAAVGPNTSQSIDASNVSDMTNPGHASVSLDHNDKEVAASEQPIGDGSSSKKREKNKKKANKKARLESPSPVGACSVNEMPPCSVAQ